MKRLINKKECVILRLFVEYALGEERYCGEISYGHHGCKKEESVFGREELGWRIYFDAAKQDGVGNVADFNKLVGVGKLYGHGEENRWRKEVDDDRGSYRIVLGHSAKGYYVLGLYDWEFEDGGVRYDIPGKDMKDRDYNTCWLAEDILDANGLLDRDMYIQDC